MTASFKRNRVRLMSGAATTLVLLLAGAGVAQAQDAEQEAVEEVVVTGIRAGIENSIAAKKAETSIVEVVSAEDIGKLPDMSIAESIARLPGLTAQRLNGRAQVISIRGLGPDFGGTLLNGREQVSTGDNRGVEFDQYPSEMLSSVVVYKTPDAALIGQGLAGTADLRTVRPLEYGKRALAVGARYEWNDIGALNAGTEDTGHRLSFSYIDQFADDTIGVALAYSNMSSPYQAERFNAWGYPNLDSSQPGNPAGNPRIIGGAKPYVQSSMLDRDGYMGVLEFKPNDRIHSTLDAFYSEFAYTEILRGIEFPLAVWGGINQVSNATVENGVVTSGTFNGVKGVVRNDANTRDSKLSSFGWNTQIDLTDNWTAELDLSTSKVERKDLILETNAGTGRAGSGATDTLDFVSGPEGTTFTAGLDYADFNLIQITSPQGWGGDVIPGGQVGYANSPSIDDELKAVRFSLSRAFDGAFVSDVEFGFNLTSREKSLRADEHYLAIGTATAIVPTEFRLAPTSLDFLGIPGMISYDAIGLLDSGFFTKVRNPNGDVKQKDWHVEEEVLTAFVKADLEGDLGSIPVTGNVGLQVVKTDQSSDAYAATGTGSGTMFQPVSGGADYTEVLPSLNLIFALPADQRVRFGAARTMARPRMDEMRASFKYTYTPPPPPPATGPALWSGEGGNPELKPWLAKAYDLSYEKYFGRKGYVSVAAFYKELETFIYKQVELYDFTGFPTGSGPAPAGSAGFITTPQNGEGGWIKGLEFTVNAPLDLIHPVLDGFGVSFSASKTESEIEAYGPGSATPLPGLSEDVINTTVYYEKHGVQARVSSRYRSDFLGEIAAFANGRDFQMVDAENVIDAQIGYAFEEGPLQGASVLFQVNNLTDEPFKTYLAGDETQVRDYQSYGRSFLLGVNYRF